MSEQNASQVIEKPQKKTWFKNLFYWPERWLEYILNILNNAAFIDIVDRLSKVSVLVAVVFYVSECEARKEQKHLEAWRVIIEMEGRSGNGGRIAALQNLNKDGVLLTEINLQGAYLANINLQNGKLQETNFINSNLFGANFENANLFQAKFGCISDSKCTDLFKATFQGADLQEATFEGNIDFRETNFLNANVCNTHFETAKYLTVDQITQAKNWQSAFYSDQMTEKLGLTKQPTTQNNQDNCL